MTTSDISDSPEALEQDEQSSWFSIKEDKVPSWEDTVLKFSKPPRTKNKHNHKSSKYKNILNFTLSDFDEIVDGLADMADKVLTINKEEEEEESDVKTKKELKKQNRSLRKKKGKVENKLLKRKQELEAEESLTLTIDAEVKYMKTYSLPIYQSKTLIEILNDIDRSLRSQIILSRSDELSLFPMNPVFRSIVNNLLSAYNFDFQMKSDKDVNRLVATRTNFTSIPSPDLELTQNEQYHPSGVSFNSFTLLEIIKYLHSKWVKSLHLSLVDENDFETVNFIRSEPLGNPNPGMPKPGEIVGQDAAPIGESNIGYQMLKKMGWKPNPDSTSKNLYESTALPLEVIFRQGRGGIGYSA